MTTTTTVTERLAALGLTLPQVAAPVGAYVPALRSGQHVFTSGQLPLREGSLVATGHLGAEIDVARGQELAQISTLNALAAVNAVADLDTVVRVVKLVGFVSSAPDFYQHPAVVNGASELLVKLFGDAGVHARSAVGVAALPLNAPVEIELTVEVG